MAKARASASLRPRAPLSNILLIGYLAAVSMVALLWASAYGISFSGPSSPPRDVRDCTVLKDDGARLACYDHVAHAVSPPPGRGFAPATR